MDNRIFNVNGSGEKMLLDALNLVFLQEGENCKIEGWSESKEHGLILHWYAPDSNTEISLFPTPLTSADCLPIVLQWLAGDFADTVELSQWCNDFDHDGSNSKGWQVYCGDWGHVGNNHGAVCAIKPAFMWHGK